MSSTPTDSDLMEAASVSQTGLTSDTVMMLIVSLGALCIAALLVVAVLRGRQAPQRRMVWVVGLLMAGIPAALLTLVAIAAAFSDGGSWLIIGVTGLWLLVGLAITRPWWAGWGFIGSALALPMLLWLGNRLLEPPVTLPIDIEQGTITYSARALLTGLVLLWCCVPRRSAVAH